MSTPDVWPTREQTIDHILAIAKSYALDRDNLAHPEDIACALGVAVEVAWRGVKPVNQ